MTDSPASVGPATPSPPAAPPTPPQQQPEVSDPPAKRRKYDALVFVPGMGGPNPDQSSEGVARRAAKALERACRDRAVRFELSPKGQDEVIGKDGSGKEVSVGVRTIVRRVGDKGDPQPVLDVYARNYSDKFTGPYERGSLFYKCLLLLFTLLRYTWPVLRSLFRKTGKSGREKVQLVWAGVLVSLLWVYMGVLVFAVYATTAQLVRDNVNVAPQEPSDGKKKEGEGKDDGKGAIEKPSTGEPAAEKPAAASQPSEWWTRWSQRIAVIGAFLLAIWPNIQKQLSRAAVLYLCAVRYLDAGDGRPVLVGDVTDILAHVLRKQGGDGKDSLYRRVDVIAYSFGSVITLDALFPFAGHSSVPCSKVDTLFTIGCPFDVIRTYWANYFDDRHPDEMPKTRWMNVYSPKDILGSNFRNDDKPGQPEEDIGIECKPRYASGTGPTAAEGKEWRDTPGAAEPVRHDGADPAVTKPSREWTFKPHKNIEYGDGPFAKQSVLEMVFLGGLKAHTAYWDPEDDGATSWYSIMVTELYMDDQILGETTTATGPT